MEWSAFWGLSFAVVGVVHKDVSLVGGGLRDVYKFHSFHFHWGRTSAEGSEHTVDGKSFPLEVSFPCWPVVSPSVIKAIHGIAASHGAL